MPKIVVTLEYESEEALKKIAGGEGGFGVFSGFSSVEDYLSRELGWIRESGFSTAGITEALKDIDGILHLKTKVEALMAKSKAEKYIDTGECLDIFNEFLRCFDKER